LQASSLQLLKGGVRWTMVMWDAIPQDRFSRGRLLLHESLYRIQTELKHDAASPVNSHLDSMTGRIWLCLEMRALAAALVSDGQNRLDHLRIQFALIQKQISQPIFVPCRRLRSLLVLDRFFEGFENQSYRVIWFSTRDD
jgi:hypothetical protein